MVEPMPGRQIQLEPYGLVFRKTFLISSGAQPALYINNYGANSFLRESADALFDRAVKTDFEGKEWRPLPFLNVAHEKYDFMWEREWRFLGDFDFALKNIVCVILPDGEEEICERSMASGLAVISPGWSYERIIAELAKQQREAKAIFEEQAKQAVEKEDPKTDEE